MALTGSAVAGDTWSVTAGTSTASYQVVTSDTLATVASSLRSQLAGDGYVAVIVPNNVLAITAMNDTSFGTSAHVTPGGAATVSPRITTETLTLGGTANTGDGWGVTVDGTNYTYTVQSGDGTSGVASQIAHAINLPSGYTAFANGSTIYVTNVTGATPAVSFDAVTRSPSAPSATVTGTPSISWTQDVAFIPGTPGFAADQTWGITVNGTTTTSTGTTNPAGDLSSKLGGTSCPAGAPGNAGNNCFQLTSSQTPYLISTSLNTVSEKRPAETVDSSSNVTTADTRQHYSTVEFLLTGTWVDNETWTLDINGVDYTYLVNGCAGNTVVDGCTLEADQNLVTIADGLAAAVNAGHGPVSASVDATGHITLTDTTTGETDPFYFSASERSGSVEGSFHLAGAGDQTGSIQVEAVNPVYAALVNAFPFLKPLFEQNQILDYTAAPALLLYQNITDGSGNVIGHQLLAQSLCSPSGNSRTCTVTYYDSSGHAITSPGYVPTEAADGTITDPLLDYMFTQPGSYELEVGANITWASTTNLGVTNTFETNGIQAVPKGMSSQLYVSLQGHPTNPNQFTFIGDQVTIVSGTGAGETATITGYDPRQSLFEVANSGWTVAPDQTSHFVIEENLANNSTYQNQLKSAPDSGNYDLVLTEPLTGSQTVTIDVEPQATPTYDAAEAFDPAANFGSNDLVQVAVATPWVTFTLAGTPRVGETWTLLLGAGSVSYTVGSTDTLGTVAKQLADAIAQGLKRAPPTDAATAPSTRPTRFRCTRPPARTSRPGR